MKAQYIRAMDAIHQRLPVRCGRLPRHHHAHHPLRRVHPLRAQQRGLVAGADGVLLMIVLSFLSAIVCYREYLHIGVGVLPASCTGTAKSCARLVPRTLHAGDQPVHAVVGHQARADHLASGHRRISRSSRSASPICRSRSAARSPTLFVIERFLTAEVLQGAEPETDQPAFDRVTAGAASWTSSFSSAASRSSA